MTRTMYSVGCFLCGFVCHLHIETSGPTLKIVECCSIDVIFVHTMFLHTPCFPYRTAAAVMPLCAVCYLVFPGLRSFSGEHPIRDDRRTAAPDIFGEWWNRIMHRPDRPTVIRTAENELDRHSTRQQGQLCSSEFGVCILCTHRHLLLL